MPQPQRTPASSAQPDGAGDALSDWKAEIARRRAQAAEAESSLREQTQQSALRMEGGGLMVRLEERVQPPKGQKRKLAVKQTSGATQSSTSRQLLKAQYDGAASDNDDVADDDAINSDLDDPDDDNIVGEEEEDESSGQIMLCTYDKVQRVKNKWKCTLKDGLLNTGGKEYVLVLL